MIISPEEARLVRKYLEGKPPAGILIQARKAWKNAISANRWHSR